MKTNIEKYNDFALTTFYVRLTVLVLMVAVVGVAMLLFALGYDASVKGARMLRDASHVFAPLSQLEGRVMLVQW